MEFKKEIRANLKFCYNLGKTPYQTLLEMRKAHKDEAPKLPTIYKWFQKFKHGQKSVSDAPRIGRPKSIRTYANIHRVKTLINTNRRLTIREISEELKINTFTVRQILSKDLQMKRVGPTIMPRILTEKQREKRVRVSQNMLSRVCEDENFLRKVVTMDESWVIGFDPETMRMCTQWKFPDEPRPRKVKASKSGIKTMLLLFFDEQGVIHAEYLPQSTSNQKYTVTAQYFISVLHKFLESLKKKRPEKISNGWIFHMDNASPHTAQITRTFLELNGISLLPQAPYSPDLAPADFWIFYRIKRVMKGTRFSSIKEIQENTEKSIEAIPEKEFKHCFRVSWIKRWKRCILAKGEYFERDFKGVDAEPAFRPPVSQFTDKYSYIDVDHLYARLPEDKEAPNNYLIEHDYC